jgi:Raf kinase inhibitor-like YbhB/YbcL family protein
MPWLGCAMQKPTPAGQVSSSWLAEKTPEKKNMNISCPDFQQGKPIPVRYTCDGEDVSPPLHWSGVPKGAKSLACVCEDPDAPARTWVHWVVVNLPPQTTGLPAGGPLPPEAVEVTNDSGRAGYGGPCPPGGTHRYFFKLFALDVATMPNLTRRNFSTEIAKHALDQAQTYGTYHRER